jgi:hypothetical protein
VGRASASGTSPTSLDTPALDHPRFLSRRRAVTTADCAHALEPLVHNAGESMARYSSSRAMLLALGSLRCQHTQLRWRFTGLLRSDADVERGG